MHGMYLGVKHTRKCPKAWGWLCAIIPQLPKTKHCAEMSVMPVSHPTHTLGNDTETIHDHSTTDPPHTDTMPCLFAQLHSGVEMACRQQHASMLAEMPSHR